MLLKEFVKWERSNGRKLSKDDMAMLLKNNPELKQATSQLLLSWLEMECRIMWMENKQSRFKRLYIYS
jgi:hypothetical protein